MCGGGGRQPEEGRGGDKYPLGWGWGRAISSSGTILRVDAAILGAMQAVHDQVHNPPGHGME